VRLEKSTDKLAVLVYYVRPLGAAGLWIAGPCTGWGLIRREA